jgi:hypothetical protein
MNTQAACDGTCVAPWIFAITVSVHLIGSAVLAGVVGGPFAVFACPLLAIFGWFFLIPELCAVWLQWTIYDRVESHARQFCLMLCASIVVGALFMGIVGPTEEGHAVRWTVAYALAGGASAAWSLVAIRWVKRLGAAINDPHNRNPNDC